MSFFGFGTTAKIDVQFRDQEKMHMVSAREGGGKRAELPLFMGLDDVAGTVFVKLPPGKKLEHQGIKVELVGQLELSYDRGNHYVFTSLLRELEPPGELSQSKSYAFEFNHVEKQHETYRGVNVRLRYFVKVKIARNYANNISKEVDFAVQNLTKDPQVNNTIKMEVGIEDCLHIEFEYGKAKYHLMDVVLGKIYFLLVRIKIKHMELQILRRESCGQGANLYNETEVAAKFEIMDGAPVRGECVPVRLMLEPYDLTPTMKDVYNKFSVKYYLNLVLVDEEDRRYFKQHEILLWRKDPEFIGSGDL